jgi:hypothetical protein
LPTYQITGRIVLSMLVLAAAAHAQSAARYHSGKLLQMESVQCVVASPDPATPASKPCQEYVLEGEGVLFHLHPQKGGDSVLLPVGRNLQYRLAEGHFYLRVSGHDREFSVVAMEPREAPKAPVHSAENINHLQ